MRISDKDLAKVFGTNANVQDFLALLIRPDELIVKDFGGNW